MNLPIVEELRPAPDACDLAQRWAGLPHLLWLDSAAVLPHLGRFSYLTADPVEFLQRTVVSPADDPLHEIDRRLAAFRLNRVPELPPFQGGLAGLLSYDLGHAFERLPWSRFNEFCIPDLALGVYDWVVAWDHQQGKAWLISTGYPHREPQARHDAAQARLEQVRYWLHAAIPAATTASAKVPPSTTPPAKPTLVPLTKTQLAPCFLLDGTRTVWSNFSRIGFERMVARAIEYIHAGDCFQVNLAHRLLHPLTETPMRIYQRLRQRNAAPFAGYFDLGDFQILSASPERFLRVSHRQVETRPIKGTRRVGSTPAEDAQQLADLTHSAKDRAENVMIVDLLRNDLGRVCRFGTVQVPSVCQVETYRYVHHLVSVVVGELRPEATMGDLLRASFPGGSVTGAPKIRAMEIIAELEPTVRGAYCGSLGYFGFNGESDLNILIRTFTAGRGWLQFPVGGGIVADSAPAREYEETLHKALGLLRVFDIEAY